MENINPILRTDSYKASHFRFYPDDLEYMYLFMTARGGQLAYTVPFGLQGQLKEDGFVKPYGDVYNAAHVMEAMTFWNGHLTTPLAYNVNGWRHIVSDHDGRPPMRIYATPEGMPVPVKTPQLVVEPTCAQCAWYPTYVEPMFVHNWFPSTVAAVGLVAYANLVNYLERTGGDKALAKWMLHDFGFRGASSPQSAWRGGAAHLVHFLGTDTPLAIVWLQRYYNGGMSGFSIPATEHSVPLSWTKDNELDCYRNALRMYPQGPLASVGDCWDIDAMLDMVCGPLKNDIIERYNGHVVNGLPNRFLPRLDSGFPPTSVLNAVERLGAGYGYRVNQLGFKVLHDAVRVVQGDGMDLQMIGQCADVLMNHGWAVENVGTFGMGGGRVQKLNRDTQSFAMKPSHVRRAGKGFDVFKSPKGDPGKRSLSGRFAVVADDDGTVHTYPIDDISSIDTNLLRPVYENGRLLVDDSLADVRARAEKFFN